MPSGAGWTPERVQHDIKDSLDAAQGSLELLQSRHGIRLPTEARDFLQVASESLLEARALVREAQRRAHAPCAIPVGQDVRLDALLAAILRDLRAVDPGAWTRVETRLDIARLVSDESSLRRILQNLLSNALRHGRIGAPVRLVAQADPGGAHLIVENQGPPIPLRERWHVFFHPVHRGLRNALDLTHELDGRLWIEAPSEEMMSVHVSLPGEWS